MPVPDKPAQTIMRHALMQQGTFDIRFSPGVRKIQADMLRGNVIPAPDVFSAGKQAAHVRRTYLIGTTDHFHRNMLFPGQKRRMACEFVHPGLP